MLVEHAVHLFERIEIPDQIGGLNLSAFPQGPPADLLDHRDIPALVAPCFAHHRRIERHPRQVGPLPARPGIAQPVAADEPLRNLALLAHIAVLLVRREIGCELLRRNHAFIAQVHARERVAVLVPDVARHVHAQKRRLAAVGQRHLVGSEKPPLALGKDQRLLPHRPWLAPRRRQRVGVAHLHGDEIRPADHPRTQPPRLRANLRAFDDPLGNVAVHQVPEEIPHRLRQRRPVSLVRTRLRQPVGDREAKPRIAEPRRLVEKRPGRHAADIARFAHGRFDHAAADADLLAVLEYDETLPAGCEGAEEGESKEPSHAFRIAGPRGRHNRNRHLER